MKTRLILLVALPVALLAQGGPRPPASWWEGPWWSNRLVQDLNLSETQKGDISSVVKEYRGKMLDVRTAMEKADADVQAAFDENPVDQRKANDAIERLATTRADLTRTLSQMSLKLRMVLTAEQWQELQRRQAGRFERGRGRGGFGPGPRNRRPPFVPPPGESNQQ
jgi:Spy/CpxP family protein refolding chaperone